jgi:hypothetical protein
VVVVVVGWLVDGDELVVPMIRWMESQGGDKEGRSGGDKKGVVDDGGGG